MKYPVYDRAHIMNYFDLREKQGGGRYPIEVLTDLGIIPGHPGYNREVFLKAFMEKDKRYTFKELIQDINRVIRYTDTEDNILLAELMRLFYTGKLYKCVETSYRNNYVAIYIKESVLYVNVRVNHNLGADASVADKEKTLVEKLRWINTYFDKIMVYMPDDEDID